MQPTTLPEALNVLLAPIIGILLAQFLAVVGVLGYMRRVVKEHDQQLFDHNARLHQIELHCAEYSGAFCRYEPKKTR